jgi:hypothetical protein
LAVLEELTGHRTAVEDPFAARLREFPGQALEAHQEAVVDRAAALAAIVWQLGADSRRAAAGQIQSHELTRLHALAEPPVDFGDATSLERFGSANRTIHLTIVERRLDDSERAQLMETAIRAFRDELVESLQRAARDVPLTGLPARSS